MRVECFECGDFIEANDLAELTSAFVSHGREKHGWAYPETSVRNYAVNYAEAEERLSAPSDRVSEIPDYRIEQVTENHVAD